MRVKDVKRAMRNNLDGLIRSLSKAITGEELRNINPERRALFRKALRDVVGTETEEVWVTGEMDRDRIRKLTNNLLMIYGNKPLREFKVRPVSKEELMNSVEKALRVVVIYPS